MDFNARDYEVYDGRDMVVGRLGSAVAKRLLQGHKVAIINAEQSIISGDKNKIVAKYRTRVTLQEKENPEHSPYWSRRPDMLVKRIVRGMLPYNKKTTGRDAYKRLRVFMGVPDEFSSAKPIGIKSRDPKTIYAGYIKVADLSKLLGYKRDA